MEDKSHEVLTLFEKAVALGASSSLRLFEEIACMVYCGIEPRFADYVKRDGNAK